MTRDATKDVTKAATKPDPPHALDHYRDAAYYDHAYRRYRDDLAFYVEMATAFGGPILELGGGTGRISLALARAGHEVVMVERMPSMLARAARRLAKAPRAVRARVTTREGDLRALALGQTFPLVIGPFNVLQHLYTRDDVERALRGVREHLAPGGRFAFDVLLPEPGAMSRDPSRFYKNRAILHPTTRQRSDYAEAFDYDHDTQILTTVIRFTPRDGGAPHYDRLTQRQFFPRELEALLHYNGFEILRHDGGFTGEPIDELAESQVVLARPRP
ncbi:MAG: class I SAM-dependent methyltransferase [Sandaracinaceae bacterium]|nr:class I SAM-dependent methyltransferase [Sandaracinaceae bacterium]